VVAHFPAIAEQRVWNLAAAEVGGIDSNLKSDEDKDAPRVDQKYIT